MIRRATEADVAEVNRLVAKHGPAADMLDFLAEKMNVCYLAEDGGALFAWRGPGIYEIHLFLGQRGRDALDVLEGMLQRLREEFDATLFWAAIPIESRYVTVDLNADQNYSTAEVGNFISDYILFSEKTYYNYENVKLGKSTIV